MTATKIATKEAEGIQIERGETTSPMMKGGTRRAADDQVPYSQHYFLRKLELNITISWKGLPMTIKLIGPRL
jgi:hypothetical protein